MTFEGELQFRGQFRNRLEQVCDQTVIGDLEDRCLLVLIDRDDDLGILHTSEVLDRAGNTDCDVKVRGHRDF